MHHADNTTIIFGHFAHHITVKVFIMTGDIYLIIEEKWRKRDKLSIFISAIEKLPSTQEKKFVLHQGNEFINVHKRFFDKHYAWWFKELLTLSIEGTPATTSTFAWWHLGVTEPYRTELNIMECEVQECNVSTTRRRNYLNSLTINPKYFDGGPIIYHISEMEQLSKGNSI